jgi:carbohydrate-selective porin OprB/mono/diheme cytochrome c family protein
MRGWRRLPEAATPTKPNARLHLAFGAVALALANLTVSAALAADTADADLIQRGHYLSIAGDCVACHTAPGGKPLAGGLALPTPVGTIVSTNITPSKTAGIGNYSLVQFGDALRKGIGADGSHLYPAMPYTSYAQISDDDVKALYAYFMHAVVPVDIAATQTSLPFPFNIRLSMAAWNLLFLDGTPFRPDPGRGAEWNRGAYLVRGLTHCSTCHTPRNLLMAEESSHDLGGGEVGPWHAPNITSDANSGIGGWSEEELIDYLRDGHAINKAQAAGPMAEAIDNSLRHMNDVDLRAIAVYLKTVPALHDDADARPVFGWGAAADDLVSIRGLALPADANQMSGPQLYDAYCATCHQSDGQGTEGGGFPSLFRNTALGRTNTSNLVMVLLDGVHRQPDASDSMMPGFARDLSDRQIATLGEYLTQRYGNPKATVTPQQVRELRAGSMSSLLIVAARIAMIVAAVLVVAIVIFLIVRGRRRRAARRGAAAGTLGVVLFFAIALTGHARLALAQPAVQPASTTPLADWLSQDTMTGNWGGLRTSLENAGITPRAHFITESAANPSGGLSQGARYTQQIDFGADLDLGKLAALPGGTVQITFTDRAGRSLSADKIGNQFAVQELFGAGQNFRLAELNYQQELLDKRLTVQLGWSPMGDDFATSPFYCHFMNGIICGHVNAMTTNSGAHNFPTAQWGARVKGRPTPEFYAATGIYQVNPQAGNSNAGFDLSLRGTGVIVPVELGWQPGRGRGELPGNYKFGGYYNSSQTPDLLRDVNGSSAGLTGAPLATHDGRWGIYVMTDQMIYRESADSPRGLTVGALGGLGDPDTAKFRYFLAGGGHYQGTFPGRDEDFVALLVAYARTNDRLTSFQQDRDIVAPGSAGIQTYESIVEIDYGAQVAPWLSLRPNLQYVIRPGGTGKIPDAFVVGLYTRVTF